MNSIKRKSIAVVGCIALFGMAWGVQAETLAYEGFDYSSTNLSGANGGGGWSTSWKSDAALTADSTADVQTNSLVAPTGLDTPIGGSVKLVDPGGSVTAYRGLLSSARLDLGVDATYYMSILAEKSNSSFTFGLNDTTGASLLSVSATTGADVYLVLGTNSVNTAGTFVGNNATYLYVVKIVASATGNDQAFVQRYHTSQTLPVDEPETWLLTTSGTNLSTVGSTVKLFGGSDRTIQYDEIRISDTWTSVLSGVPDVPEVPTVITLAYEGFDYSSATLAGANGGVGWSTAWKSDASLTTACTVDVQTNSLAAPTGLDAPIGGSVKLVDPGGSVTAYRGLASAARLDMGVDAIYYMSILAEKSNSSFTFGLNDTTGASLLSVSATTGADVYLVLGTNSVNTAGTFVGNNATYLYVIKIVASATGNDQAFIQRYHTSLTLPVDEPETWLLSGGAVDLGTVGSTVKLFGGSDRTIQYDEIRFGHTWASVLSGDLSVPVIGDIAVEYLGVTGLALTWSTGTGFTYTLWEKADLVADPIWNVSSNGIPGGVKSVTVTTAVDAVQAFYKVTSE